MELVVPRGDVLWVWHRSSFVVTNHQSAHEWSCPPLTERSTNGVSRGVRENANQRGRRVRNTMQTRAYRESKWIFSPNTYIHGLPFFVRYVFLSQTLYIYAQRLRLEVSYDRMSFQPNIRSRHIRVPMQQGPWSDPKGVVVAILRRNGFWFLEAVSIGLHFGRSSNPTKN